MKDKFMKLVHTIPTVTCYAMLVVDTSVISIITSLLGVRLGI